MTHSTRLRVILSKIERMTVKKPPGVVWLSAIILLLPAFLDNGYAQISDILSSKNIEVQINSLPSVSANINTSSVQWNILDKLQEKDDELEKIPVSIGPREMIYHENRISLLPYKTEAECLQRKGTWDGNSRVCKSITKKRLSEKEMTLGLKLLNTETGEINIIKIGTKINTGGVFVVAPSGYQIETVERSNGIKWNLWNTTYRVVTPGNTVVIKNNFPRKEKIVVSKVVKGKTVKHTKEVIEGFLYVPRPDFLGQEEHKKILVESGIAHDKSIVSQAFATLRERGVRSKTFPNKLVSDVEALSPRFFERLPLLEQGDFTEFQLNPQNTTEGVLVILGANGENAWKHTCNKSHACGWVQFTPRTYKSIRTSYTKAKLITDFKAGAGNQLNSIMAAILLHDYNLSNLVQKYGDKILLDPHLEEYLAAAYNGAPKWVHNSLYATLAKGLPDWVGALSSTRKDSRGGLRNETRDFMTKLRYLVANDLP